MEKITVRQMRLMHEKTQEEFAKVLGISTQGYINKETGKSRFYFDEVCELCAIVGFDWGNIKPDKFDE